MTTESVTIFDIYNETAKNIANKVIIDCANDKVNNNTKYSQEYYIQKYISEYIFKDNLIEQHYQLAGYLSFISKFKYSANEISDNFEFNIEDVNLDNYDNIINCIDDIILSLTFKVMMKLVLKEIKNNEFK